jgi:protein-tyrosine-phosphatase
MQTPSTAQDLQKYCETLEAEFSLIPDDRKENLQKISAFLKEKSQAKQTARLMFICTHNSRRSQFAQVWAGLASQYYQVANTAFFSGGTEATACNPRTVSALQRAGVQITKVNEISAPITVANNPRYETILNIGKDRQVLYLFSKKYNEEGNPTEDFCAVLVCSQADESCPVVRGAKTRVYHGYEDPKKSDGSSEEAQTYDETCRLIAREMFYVFSQAR